MEGKCARVCVCVQLIDSLLWREREKSEWKREEDLGAFFSELHNSQGVWAVLWSTHSDKLSLHPSRKEAQSVKNGWGGSEPW